jgi:hypothetical protein
MMDKTRFDLHAASLLLTRCFIDDEMLNAQLTGIEDKELVMERLLEMQLHVFQKIMDIETLDNGSKTLMVGYEKNKYSKLKEIYYGLMNYGILSKAITAQEMKTLNANTKRIAQDVRLDWAKEYIKGNYYYIKIMAIDKAERGKGNFRLLIEPVINKYLKQKIPIVLETNTESNKAIYEHFGFSEKKTIPLRSFGFNIYCYAREN